MAVVMNPRLACLLKEEKYPGIPAATSRPKCPSATGAIANNGLR